MSITYTHVDVFSSRPYGGNSLPVFMNPGALSSEQMLRITQELRHFEAIFLEVGAQTNHVRARVFDLVEELPFAGHPIIGAAAVLHHHSGQLGRQIWQIDLTHKSVSITTEPDGRGYFGLLDQGVAAFLATVDERESIARAFNIESSDLEPDLPLEVISTGLAYLIVPVKSGALERAHISQDITVLVQSVGAQYAVLFDEANLEVRHWNNDGIIEDVATGSAAGPIGAYRLRHGLASSGKTFILNQGRFTGRPSTLRVQPEAALDSLDSVKVGGNVSLVGRGVIEVLP